MTPMRAWGAALVLLAACNPNTNRPPVRPLPGALEARIGVAPARAVTVLTEALRADSLPVAEVQADDGYLESPWFLAETGEATDRRPLGERIVRLRAWIDRASNFDSKLTLELVYRAMADPSVPQRELERLVPDDHPASTRAQRVLDALKDRFPPAVGG